MKFRYLKINLATGLTYNCHASEPHPINFDWLKDNPGNLFNTDINVKERHMMLRNERASSCEQNCWAAEDREAVSPRLYQGGAIRTHLTPVTTPEMVDLTVSLNCNLTCSYCCKEFSSAWRRDLIKNGDYDIAATDQRFRIQPIDLVLERVSQRELHNSQKYSMLANEIRSYAPTLKKLDITGGEPFLDNQLVETLSSLDLNPDCRVVIYTGLGVDLSRFERLLNKLVIIPNLIIKVSAEGIGDFLEFNRYGSKWDDFQRKIDLLDRTVDWRFQCTLTNLTLLGFYDFYNFFRDREMDLTFAYQPRIMSPFVLDIDSKQRLTEQMSDINPEFRSQILASLKDDPTDIERQGIRNFLSEFVARRSDLSLKIFPASFLKWTELDHVV
jgi:organic radical activating enzyme